MTKDATMRAVDALVAKLAERDGSDDFTVAAEMVRAAGLDVAYALATAALIGSARSKRRAVALETERRHQRDTQPLHETPSGRRTRQERPPMSDEEYAAYEAISARQAAAVNRALEIYTAEVRMQWEAELLESTFALGDGTVVTWGAATIEQHTERAEMFKRNAMANAEGYARHQRAINDLRESGASTLGQMMAVAA